MTDFELEKAVISAVEQGATTSMLVTSLLRSQYPAENVYYDQIHQVVWRLIGRGRLDIAEGRKLVVPTKKGKGK